MRRARRATGTGPAPSAAPRLASTAAAPAVLGAGRFDGRVHSRRGSAAAPAPAGAWPERRRQWWAAPPARTASRGSAPPLIKAVQRPPGDVIAAAAAAARVQGALGDSCKFATLEACFRRAARSRGRPSSEIGEGRALLRRHLPRELFVGSPALPALEVELGHLGERGFADRRVRGGSV